MNKEALTAAPRPGKHFLHTAQVIRDVLKAAEEDGSSFTAWLSSYLVVVSITDQPVMLHISFYRCFPLKRLTTMYPAQLRRLNVSGTPEPFSITLSNPEAIFRYGVQVWIEAPLAPVTFQKIISSGRARAEEGYRKVIG